MVLKRRTWLHLMKQVGPCDESLPRRPLENVSHHAGIGTGNKIEDAIEEMSESAALQGSQDSVILSDFEVQTPHAAPDDAPDSLRSTLRGSLNAEVHIGSFLP